MTPRLISILLILIFAVLHRCAHASSGTGFAIANGALVVTNYHVVDGCTTVNIPNVGAGTIKATDPRADLAIIELERPVGGFLRFRTTSHQLRLGEEIVVIGFPLQGFLSSSPIVTTGIVSSLAGIKDDPNRLQITAPIQ